MTMKNRLRPGLLLTTVGVAVVLGASLAKPAVEQPVPWPHQVRTVADHTSDHGEDHGDHHGGGIGAILSERPDKAEPTLSGLRSPGLLHTDLTRPGAAVNGLSNTLSMALSPNRQIVQSDLQTVNAGQRGDVEVACPRGYDLFNGGESNTGNMVRLVGNYPNIGGQGTVWHVEVFNDDSTARMYRAYADCISGANGYVQEQQSEESDPGAYGFARLACPSGMNPLGGGYRLDTVQRVAINQSMTLGSDWNLDWRNLGSSPVNVATYAICSSAGPFGAISGDYISSEYGESQQGCSQDENLAGGWIKAGGLDDGYIIVTDSYPATDGSQVVWAHNGPGQEFSALINCGSVP